MKKINFLILSIFLLIFISGCDRSNLGSDDELNDDNNETIYYSNPFEKLDYGFASIELDKEIYEQDDDIVITINDAATTDYIGIYSIDSEPGNGIAIKKSKVSDKTSITYSIKDLKLSPGEYSVCLYQNKTSHLYDRIVFKVHDGDNTNYMISSAKFICENKSKVRNSSLTIYPKTDKELTYSIYWSKDGKRLDDYSVLEKIKIGDALDGFTINFNENMFMPSEANQIEIAILEGMSTSYFLDVDDTLKLEKSKYLYNFQVLTDIHVNTDMARYGFWSSHLYNALYDIKCLSGNTSGIFTVGDNTDMGSSSHYDLLFSTIDSVFKDDVPNIYYTMGNHDYMYFTEEVGAIDAAIEYFITRTGMQNNYYSIDLNGNKVIVLGSELQTEHGEIYDEQMNWFKNELANSNKDEFIFIYLHQPLYNTVAGTLPGDNNHGIDIAGEEIKKVLKDYPNAILFSGHTHYSLYGENTAVFGNGSNANYVNNGAVAYLWTKIDKDGEVGGQCNFVEVYEDYIIIKGRDLLEKKWISQAQFVIYKY